MTREAAGEAGVMPRRGAWSKRDTARFLEVLATTADVAGAAATIGRGAAGAQAKWRLDPAFRQGWAAALDEGRMRIETRLVAQMLSGRAADPDFDAERAMKLLAMLKAQDRMDGRRSGQAVGEQAGRGAGAKAMTMEQVEASLLRKLRAVARRASRPVRPA